jgi:hypothetical protein
MLRVEWHAVVCVGALSLSGFIFVGLYLCRALSVLGLYLFRAAATR